MIRRPLAGLALASITLAGCASQDEATTAPTTQSAMMIDAPSIRPRVEAADPATVSPMSERDARRLAAYRAAVAGIDFSGVAARVTEPLTGTGAERQDELIEAEAAMNTGRETDAIAAYVRALRLDDADAVAWADLAHALAMKGKLDESFASYEAALDLDPQNPDLRFDMAMKQLWTGDRPASIAAFNEVLDVAPDHGRAHVRLAVLHYYEGDLGQSRRHVVAADRAGVAPPPQFLGLLEAAEATGG